MNIAQDINKKLHELTTYRDNLYKHLGAVGLRWIDDSFKAQGWRNNTLIPWHATQSGKSNTFGNGTRVSINADGQVRRKKVGGGILIGRGAVLRRSFHSDAPGIGKVRFYTDIAYAKAHNEGFKGVVNVKAHSRRVVQRQQLGVVRSKTMRRQKVSVGEAEVKAHTMNMNLPRRQFMPTITSPSVMFNKTIWDAINKDVTRIISK